MHEQLQNGSHFLPSIQGLPGSWNIHWHKWLATWKLDERKSLQIGNGFFFSVSIHFDHWVLWGCSGEGVSSIFSTSNFPRFILTNSSSKKGWQVVSTRYHLWPEWTFWQRIDPSTHGVNELFINDTLVNYQNAGLENEPFDLIWVDGIS